MQLPDCFSERFQVIEPIGDGNRNDSGCWLVAARNLSGLRVLKISGPGSAERREIDDKLENIGARYDHVLVPEQRGVMAHWRYEISEYFPAGALRDNLSPRQSRVGLATIEALVEQLHPVIEALHAQPTPVVHGDIKPANILVRRRGAEPWEFVLADFDSAVVVEDESEEAIGHSPRYAAPETLRTGRVWPASDYWSLGMVIMEMLLGEHPLAQWDASRVRLRLAKGWKPPFGQIDEPRWRSLCGGLLQEDPDNRWDSKEIRRWLENDISIVSRGLALAGEGVARTPLQVGDRNVLTIRDLAAALIREWRVDLLGARELQEWLNNGLSRQDAAARLRALLNDRNLTPDLRLLHFALALDDELEPVWRGKALTGEGLVAAARAALDGDRQGLEWLRSLLDGRCFDAYAQRDNKAIAKLREQFLDGWEQYQAAWNEIIAAGAPETARPDPDVALPLFTSIACSASQRKRLRDESLRFLDATTLLSRESWFLRFGTDLSRLSLAQLAVLRALDETSLASRFNLASIGNLGGFDRNSPPRGITVLASQRQLLKGLAAPPDHPIVELRAGDVFDANRRDNANDWWTSAEETHDEGSTGEDTATNELDLRVRLIHLSAALQHQPFPATVGALALRISWRAPRTMRARLLISHPGRLAPQRRLTTPILPPEHSLLLLITSDTRIQLTGRRGWLGLRRYRSPPITILFQPQRRLLPPERKMLGFSNSMTKALGFLTPARGAMRKIEEKLRRPQPLRFLTTPGRMLRSNAKPVGTTAISRIPSPDKSSKKLFTLVKTSLCEPSGDNHGQEQ